ncbi:hypothetical protein PHET_09461 [Paragonimus heterotremus]|uniref:Nuclear nucleic acid-binding protein C1D n=1 Tax=Paragonimus heterotremus TaxID=100268 RepID=A0A8J4SV84_9TREM|nr:hypothetical protein PHET_09461 [Paragonimus heterotremus]
MMVEGCIFDEIPEEISVHLVSFSEALDNIQSLISNHMSSSLSHKTEKSNLEVIKHELSLCYTLNALFFIYLRCNGVDTSTHPIMQELDRVMAALKRCRALSDKNSTSHLRCDKEAASRFIKHALWQSAHSKAKKRRPNSEQV